MMKSRLGVWLCAGVLLGTLQGSALAQAWRGVVDENGFTWARVLVVNQSEADSNWSISGCRTALDSTEFTADIDPLSDWSGLVEPGASMYVWVYGRGISEITLANADGAEASFLGSFALDMAGDGQLVVMVNADGSSSVAVEACEAFEAPAVLGTLPED